MANVWLTKSHYILDQRDEDEHYLRVYKGKNMVMACVFNPSTTVKETHDEKAFPRSLSKCPLVARAISLAFSH
ncbi:hypothetical protein EKN09_28185 [Vibrio penaeicida]|nr:hypothetical protein EKN09_28185 [Vibrio penaeicida]